ncbi:MAG: class I tRNA ligase family protein [Patescibacteria group bacterium]|nr:class I tRNA ligase family protein [Patescibacteria group bacterium]
MKDDDLAAEKERVRATVASAMEQFKFNEALEAIWDLIRAGDLYVNQEKPWTGEKPDVIGNLLGVLNTVATLLEPFLPHTARSIKAKLADSAPGEPLFPRL